MLCIEEERRPEAGSALRVERGSVGAEAHPPPRAQAPSPPTARRPPR
eukprot:CAMPEP_0179446294 /NCGR_PEP_ID=MMETSP0799-20121207/29686_1 /TAXON_ID=46947 /ORGANISM="Geminigera cryophila, Strain CCMP2564" /LENGTH=46 /DNA_ID= /DNA_START= /DNA_END= /DNA_ORIENTATION=